jgi:hypothetical protein
LIEALTKWLTQYESEWYQFKEKKTNDQTQLYMKRLNAAHRERQGLYKQRDNLYNLVERGAYDIDTYIARSKVLTQEIEVSEELIKNIEAEFELYKQKVSVNYEIIPKMRGLLADYYNLNLKERNDALKSILNQAVFFKSKEWWGNKFELELSVKL